MRKVLSELGDIKMMIKLLASELGYGFHFENGKYDIVRIKTVGRKKCVERGLSGKVSKN